jgi:hypothetical protein
MFDNFNKKIYLPVLILVLLICPFTFFRDEGEETAIINNVGDIFYGTSHAAFEDELDKPLLAVTPRELDLEGIAPGKVAGGVFSLRSVTGIRLQWIIDGPEGWEVSDNQRLTGSTAVETDQLRLSIKNDLTEFTDETKPQLYSIRLNIEAGNKSVQFMRELPAGTYREMIKFTYPGGIKAVYFSFEVTDTGKPAPLLTIDPTMIDFGIIPPGRQVAKRVKVTNKGREAAKWHVLIPKTADEKRNMPPLGRYVSFLNNEIKRGSNYVPPGHLKNTLEMSGKWREHEGYPTAYGVNNFVRYHFSGTGICLYLRRGTEEGKVAVYLDDQLTGVYDGNAVERGTEEFIVADNLPEGPHVLSLANGDGYVIIEGASVYGRKLLKGNQGWVNVSPDSGVTFRETDYVTVQVSTQRLNPGCYAEQIVLASNQGDVLLTLSVEVRPDQQARIFDVYRYVRNHNYLFTTNPQLEMNRIQSGAYRKEGIAYRLFPPGTPGTTEFYRWYSVEKDDHYYSYDLNGNEKPPKGYVFEGTIGNIGTSKLTNLRELYRWFNPSTGRHFYTTYRNGEGMAQKGYNFNGIAGYVK